MKIKNKNIYNWTHNLEEGIKNKELIKMKPEDDLELVIGEKNIYNLSVIFSSDEITIAKFTMTPKSYSEIESHNGDEFINVLKGKLIVNIYSDDENTNPDSVTKYCHEINSGEKMYIPKGFKHVYKNLGSVNVKAIIAYSPEL